MADNLLPELLPCPFCGSDAEHLTLRDHRDVPHLHIVQCVRGCATTETDDLMPDAAIKTWNRRSPPQPDALVEALTNMLKAYPVSTSVAQTDAIIKAHDALRVARQSAQTRGSQ